MSCPYRHHFEVEGHLLLCRWCGDSIVLAAAMPETTPPVERGKPPPARIEPLPPDPDAINELEAQAVAASEAHQRRLLARLLREGGMMASDAELLEAQNFNAGQAEPRMVEVDPDDEDIAPEGSTRF